MNQMLAVFIGGGLGSLARYGLSKAAPLFGNTNFPLATFISNTLACLLLVLFFVITKEKMSASFWSFFVVTGFCGGFSTFSTFSYETVTLFQTGYYGVAITNILLSLFTCLLIVFIFNR